MSCAACGSPNPAGRKFCGECGARLALACASCAAPLDAGQKFCGECGSPTTSVMPAAPAGPAAPAAVPVAVTAERRLVSVLFADLVGFTPYSEGRDAEEVRETLTRYFELARDAIGRHGGTVEKFIGDAVMAVWGTPTAREDDAERAVRAALELLDAVSGLGHGIAARAGVMTGEAAVTLGATDQGMVAGDLVNTAARVQGVATPGTVLVGEATYRAASAAIAFEEAGEHALKGKEEPVRTWRALRVVAERGGRGRQELLEPPFVGRAEELRLLKELFHATVREGRARSVSITGPAGIGKSRLAWEFEKYLDGVVDSVWWHHGRSPSYGAGMTFWALGEMIRTRAGLAESADEATTRTAVAAMLERFVPDPAERAWVEPAILALLGLQASAVSGDELFARWRVLFERLSATGTVVLVFEDLHWADPATLAFIDHLLDWSKQVPILIVTLARPDLLEQRPEWGAGRRSFLSVALDPLPEPAVRELLAGLVPALPEDAVRQIVARAEGIPLYAVETIRMLVADKRLVAEGNVYVPTGDISTLAVPETLTALIAARLDALEPLDRSILLDAAVLGQTFTLEALASVAGLDAAGLEPRLRSLVRRELLTLQADPRSPERGQYSFVQALIREVAYNTLAKRDRKEHHLAAARYFESLGSDELAGALALHYLAAYEHASGEEEAHALATQARIALRGAAERAVQLASYSQACELLGQALTVAETPLDRADILERRGLAAGSGGRHEDALTWLGEAMAMSRDAGDEEMRRRVLGEMGRAFIAAKRFQEARDLLAPEADALEGDLSSLAAMGILANLARATFLLEDPRAAIPICDEVLEPAEHAENHGVMADVLVTKGSCYALLGRVQEGTGVLELGRDIARRHGLLDTELRALNNLLVYTAGDDVERALRASEDGLVASRRASLGVWLPAFASAFLNGSLQTGDWDAADRELEQALELEAEPSDRLMVLAAAIDLGVVRGLDVEPWLHELKSYRGTLSDAFLDNALESAAGAVLRDRDRAYADAGRAFEHAATIQPSTTDTNSILAARAWAWGGAPTEARAAIARFDGTYSRQRNYLAMRTSVLGMLAAAEGDVSRALADFRRADAMAVEVGDAYERVRITMDAGRALGADDPWVAERLEDARQWLEERRAGPLVELIDEMRASSRAPLTQGGSA